MGGSGPCASLAQPGMTMAAATVEKSIRIFREARKLPFQRCIASIKATFNSTPEVFDA